MRQMEGEDKVGTDVEGKGESLSAAVYLSGDQPLLLVKTTV